MCWNGRLTAVALICVDWKWGRVQRGQTFWPTIPPQWDPSASGRERGGGQRLSPSTSAAWVIQESYSQVKLWPFNGTYCKGMRWSWSRDTNSFIRRGARSAFARVGTTWTSDPRQRVPAEKLFSQSCPSFFGLFLHSRGLSRRKHAQSSRFGKVAACHLTNIQLTPCTCMLVISSELQSALAIRRLNQRLTISINHRHFNTALLCSVFFVVVVVVFLPPKNELQSLDIQDIAVVERRISSVDFCCCCCEAAKSSLPIDSSSTRSTYKLANQKN